MYLLAESFWTDPPTISGVLSLAASWLLRDGEHRSWLMTFERDGLPGRAISDYPAHETAWLRESDGEDSFACLGEQGRQVWYWELCQIRFQSEVQFELDDFEMTEVTLEEAATQISELYSKAYSDDYQQDIANRIEIPFDDSDAGPSSLTSRVHYSTQVGAKGISFQLGWSYCPK